jgi:hypothetical protein
MFCVSLELVLDDLEPAVPEDLHIDIELQGGLLFVTATGRLAFDSAWRLLKQVFETAAEKQVNEVLVNTLTVKGELATFERYALGVEIASYLSERRINLKLAFVGVPPALNGFVVRVAQNRGIVTEMFSTLQEAMKWLEEPERREWQG